MYDEPRSWLVSADSRDLGRDDGGRDRDGTALWDRDRDRDIGVATRRHGGAIASTAAAAHTTCHATMASRRHVVPIPELRKFDFLPILHLTKATASAHVHAKDGLASGAAAAADAPAAAPTASVSAEPPTVVGISTRSVDIVSSRGASIGTEKEMDDITEMVEQIANNATGNVAVDSDSDSGTPASIGTVGTCTGTRKRRLLPPEIVFPGAYVAIRFRLPQGERADSSVEEKSNKVGEVNSTSSMSPMKTLEIQFDARSALAEWAEAHGPLVDHQATSANGLPISEDSSVASGSKVYSSVGGGVNSSVGGVDGPEGSRGVFIMKTIDAHLWERGRGADGTSKATSHVMRQATKPSDISLTSSIHSTTSASASASDFRYDWTYSSPYAGTLVYRDDPSDGENEAPCGLTVLNGRNLWTPIASSGIDLALLSDRSQPILYFDDVTLYEDDLHDNGVSHLNVKIRVMPKCFFVLYRLVVRVDYVTVRCRDVRAYHRFGAKEVFRDVTWRECKWGCLVPIGLPDDVGRWRVEDAVDATASASIQALLGRLPKQTLPPDIPEYSKFELA